MEKPSIFPLSLPNSSILEGHGFPMIASAVNEIRAESVKRPTANLLVVNLHVKPYKPKRGESREILPRSRYQGTGASEEA
jgi:hypothetical protein